MLSTSRRPSRRGLLGAAAGAGALLLAGCGGGGAATATTAAKPSGASAERDVQILTGLLELERRTVAAYIAAIPLLPRPHAQDAQQFLNEELEHTGELISLIRQAGGKAGPRANSFELGHPADAGQVVALLHSLETLQVGAYLRQIPRLAPGPIRAAAASILTVDAQHVSMWRLIGGHDPVPAAFVTGSE